MLEMLQVRDMELDRYIDMLIAILSIPAGEQTINAKVQSLGVRLWKKLFRLKLP